MRMRKMKNLESRMEACAAYRIVKPETMKGNWKSLKEDAAAPRRSAAHRDWLRRFRR